MGFASIYEEMWLQSQRCLFSYCAQVFRRLSLIPGSGNLVKYVDASFKYERTFCLFTGVKMLKAVFETAIKPGLTAGVVENSCDPTHIFFCCCWNC